MRNKQARRLRSITAKYFDENKDKATKKITRLFYQSLKRTYNDTPKPGRSKFLKTLEVSNELLDT
jgi:hypothetical protein